MKINPPLFKGIEFKDAFEFLIYFHDCLHKMGIVVKYGMEFVSF